MTITQTATVNFDSPDGFFNYEATDNNGNMIATIAYDDDQHLSWGVFVNDIEIHRTHTVMRAQHYIMWHYKQKTLPIWQSVEKIDNESETIEDDIELDQSVRLFTHVKRSLVKVTLAIVISSGCIASIANVAFSYELPLLDRIGNPVVSPKPKPSPKPYRGGSRRDEYTPPDNGSPDGTVGSGTRVSHIKLGENL